MPSFFLNQSGKVLLRVDESGLMFCAEGSHWIFTLPLSKLEELGFFDNNKLITIEVYIQVLEVFHQGKSTDNDLVDFNGVKVLSSQVTSISKIYMQHPHFFLEKEQPVYFALFFFLMETLSKSPQSLSLTELTNVQNGLTELTKAGFKLDFFKSKLAEVSLDRKKAAQIKYASAPKVSSFEFINFFIKKFFLSCFSI